MSGVTVLIGGLVAAVTGFLLGERALRPTFALALEGRAPPDQPSLGLGTRLVLIWALGASLPSILIGATPFLVPSADLGVEWAIVTLAGIALVAGYTITALAARSISRPLARVREALREVGEGNLALDVVVDDSGELGRLQAGVNEMVAGLRERERVEDLFERHVGHRRRPAQLAEGVTLGRPGAVRLGPVRRPAGVDGAGPPAVTAGRRGPAQPVLRHRRRVLRRRGRLARQVRGRRGRCACFERRSTSSTTPTGRCGRPGRSPPSLATLRETEPTSTPGSGWRRATPSPATSGPSTGSSTR